MSNSKKLAELSAKVYYLSELQKHNLITPSIGIPYPRDITKIDEFLVHSSYRKIQQLRINDIRRCITSLKNNGTVICWNTFLENKSRFIEKIQFMKTKFNPRPVKKVKCKLNNNRRKIKNKKSKERYKARLIKKKYKLYSEHPERRTVINLSSHTLSMSEVCALELGYGFVPTPTNKEKEEEVLILEGLRFVDRVGKIDSKITKENSNPSDSDIINSVDARSLLSGRSVPVTFIRDKTIPKNLQFFQPKEPQPTQKITKMLIKEFGEFNSKLIDKVKSAKAGNTKKFNLPKKVHEALIGLKKLVRDKKLDIRKVDKGQKILVIDYQQRKKAEELNINVISIICEDQSSNWSDNRSFIENKLRLLNDQKFITNSELTAVTGLIVGGVSGTLKNRDGTVKYTRATDSNELFAKQKTPYVYPLFKLHKIPFENLSQIAATQVAEKIPSRLVVGMASCQMYRVQAWLEHFLTPLSRYYGSFEYINDTNDMLVEIENVKVIAQQEQWNWDNLTIFTVDVKALYPSIQFRYLEKALKKCFCGSTSWSEEIINILIEIILYTLSSQQILWDGKYHMLNQGIPTGAKHSVPLANIFLSFIILDLINSNPEFKSEFDNEVKLWKRFIDDCCGILSGDFQHFLVFFKMLSEGFSKFGLELTCDTDTHIVDGENITAKDNPIISFLDIDIFKADNTIHTCEHRKETSATAYLLHNSAHPRHTFSGIVKSQLYRLRRLCSRDVEFVKSVADLKVRCLNSKYPAAMVNEILDNAPNISRTIRNNLNVVPDINQSKHTARLVILSGTSYEYEIINFVSRMNDLSREANIKIEVVKSTGLSISRLLFNNCEKGCVENCDGRNCIICNNDMNKGNTLVKSSVTGQSYKVNMNLNCTNSGIYVVTGGCLRQYSGKTTVPFCNRTHEHFHKLKQCTLFLHRSKCAKCKDLKDCSIAFAENSLDRGKYSLSEREYLWDHRIKGTINTQKILMS